MTTKEIITLIEGTGMYYYDEEITKKLKANKNKISLLKFIANDELTIIDWLDNLTIPIDISASNLSNILDKAYSIYYKNRGKKELQFEIRKLLGFFSDF